MLGARRLEGQLRRLELIGRFAILSFGQMTKKWSKPMAWSDKFNHPIKWGARSIYTLHYAHLFILGLSGLQRMLPAWQDAHKLLSQAAEHGGLWRDLARIEIMNALLGSKPEGG